MPLHQISFMPGSHTGITFEGRHFSKLLSSISTISKFTAYVKNTDNFVGHCRLINCVWFRPGNHSNYLSLKADSHCFSLWTIGCVSSGNLFVSPNSSFNVSYTNSMVDERIASTTTCTSLTPSILNCHPCSLTLFLDSNQSRVYTLARNPTMFSTWMVATIKFRSAKMFERVSTSLTFSMPLWAAYIASRIQMAVSEVSILSICIHLTASNPISHTETLGH